MEPTTQTTQTPPTSQPTPTAAPPKPKRGKGMALFLLVIILIAAAAGGVYFWQQGQASKTKKSLDEANAKVTQLNGQVSDLNGKVAELEASQKTLALPTASDFSPQCESSNNNELIVAALTPEPVNNYQAYVEFCGNKTDIPPRVVAFKVGSDGKRSFAFGAGTGEPFCISERIIDKTAAKSISTQTKVPLCKTF